MTDTFIRQSDAAVFEYKGFVTDGSGNIVINQVKDPEKHNYRLTLACSEVDDPKNLVLENFEMLTDTQIEAIAEAVTAVLKEIQRPYPQKEPATDTDYGDWYVDPITKARKAMQKGDS